MGNPATLDNFDIIKGSHYIPSLCGTEGPFIVSQLKKPLERFQKAYEVLIIIVYLCLLSEKTPAYVQYVCLRTLCGVDDSIVSSRKIKGGEYSDFLRNYKRSSKGESYLHIERE